MSYCLNPSCQKRQNPDRSKFCHNCGTKLLVGDRYRAVAQIAQGGFGRTLLAVDEYKPSQPKCVIKQFAPQGQGNISKALELFQQEAVRLEDLGKHDRIPKLLAYCHQDDSQYLVQEFIDGQNLEEELAEQGVFPQVKVRELLGSLLPVLQFIHDGGVIHRDIKPENIIRRRSSHTPPISGNEGELVLVDFGAAKHATSTALLKTGTSIGSAEYVAPEQARGKAVFASDIYGLGVTCIYLLTGISPFDLIDGDNIWVWQDYLNGNDISPELIRILNRAIAPAVNQRYQSTAEVLSDLNSSLIPKVKVWAIPQTYHGASPPRVSVVRSPSNANLIYNSSSPTITRARFSREIDAEMESLRRSLGSTHPPLASATARSPVQTVLSVQSINSFIEDLGRGVLLETIYIPGGSFLMGSPEYEENRTDLEGPQHLVTVAPFYMSKYPITQMQWRAIAALRAVRRSLNPDPSVFQGSTRPVENVSWRDALEFCNRLARKTGIDYRLPSEAEWEYACRAGTTTAFSFGDVLSPDVANYGGSIDYFEHGRKFRYPQQTTNVGRYPANAFGLYDLHGNVWEWCADPWHKNYFDAPTDGRVWQTGGDTTFRLLRGGSWFCPANRCRSAFRYKLQPDDSKNRFGFRVVCSAMAAN